VTCLPKVHEDQEANGNETAHDYTIPSLLVAYPANQAVDAGHLASRSDYATVDAGERLPLDAELLVDGIRLCKNGIRHVVTVVYATAFIQHIICLCLLGVLCTVCIDVIANVGQEVGAISLVADVGLELVELSAVLI
jgi:hypothetical protein